MEQEFPKPLFYPIDSLSEGGVWKKVNLIVFWLNWVTCIVFKRCVSSFLASEAFKITDTSNF